MRARGQGGVHGERMHTQRGVCEHRHRHDLLQQMPVVELMGGGHPAAAEGDDLSSKAVLPCRRRQRREPHQHPGPSSRGTAPGVHGTRKPPEQPHLT